MGHEDFGVDLSWTCVPRSVGHLFIDVFKQREQLGFLFVKRCSVKESPRMVHRHATSEGIMFQLRMSVHYLSTGGVELLNHDCGQRSFCSQHTGSNHIIIIPKTSQRLHLQ